MIQIYKTNINASMNTLFKVTYYSSIQWDIIIQQMLLSVNSMAGTVWDLSLLTEKTEWSLCLYAAYLVLREAKY